MSWKEQTFPHLVKYSSSTSSVTFGIFAKPPTNNLAECEGYYISDVFELPLEELLSASLLVLLSVILYRMNYLQMRRFLILYDSKSILNKMKI